MNGCGGPYSQLLNCFHAKPEAGEDGTKRGRGEKTPGASAGERESVWENQRAIARAKKETQSVCAEGRGGTEAQRDRSSALENVRWDEIYWAAARSERLNKFGRPNLFTLDIDRRRRAGAQKPAAGRDRVPLGR